MFELSKLLFKTSRWMLTLAIVMGLISGIGSAGMIALIVQAITSIGLKTSSIFISFIALASITLGASILSQILLVRLSQDSVQRIQTHLCSQILDTDLALLERLGKPRLMATLTDDIQTLTEGIARLPWLCIDLVIVGFCLIYIFWLSRLVFLLVITLMILAIASSRSLMIKGRYWIGQAREDQDTLFQVFRGVVDGTKELKLHDKRRQAFLEDLNSFSDSFKQKNIKGLTFFSVTTSWGKLIFYFAIGFLLFLFPRFFEFSPEILSSYIFVFIYLMAPMERTMNTLPILSRAKVALDKIKTIGIFLSQENKISQPRPHFEHSLNDWNSLKLINLSYAYQSEQGDDFFHLGPINLTISRGEVIFVIGGNGSGKSTLIKLIVGLYIPENGEIQIDNQRIDESNIDFYRQKFSVVFYDFYLFDRLLGLSQEDPDQKNQFYLNKLHLNQVKIQNGKFSTTSLSQGLRKRLALFTAYLEDRQIYIFDEWAADQDPYFKDVFYKILIPELKKNGKTIIVITHDDHYFYLADRQIKLNSGKIEYDKIIKNMQN